jgi:hypothetical protein
MSQVSPQCGPKLPFPHDPGIPNGVQVLAWQFSAECVGVDCSIVNPACVQQLTDGLILPPVPALPPVVGAAPLGGAAPVSATLLRGVQVAAAAVRPTAATTTTLSVPARPVTVNITVNVGENR